MKAFLLCAGLGTRFLPTTNKVAKPAIPFLNVPLHAYSLYYLEQLGLKQLIVNTHHLPETITTSFNSIKKNDYSVNFLHEEKILGSGGGIKNIQVALNASDDFIVANGDEVFVFDHDFGFGPLLDFHKKNGALATLLTTEHPEAGKTLGGIWCDESGLAKKLGGQADMAGAKHFVGVYVFSPKIFNYMPAGGEFHIFKDCLDKALASGEKIMTFHDPNIKWFDMTSEKDYIHSTRKALELLIEESKVSQNLMKILNRFDQFYERLGDAHWLGKDAEFNGELLSGAILLQGENSFIGTAVTIKDFAVLGSGARFEQGVIEAGVLRADTHIHTISSLRKQLVL